MTVSDEAARQAVTYWLRIPGSGRCTACRHRSDFGGPDSYRLKVRRIGKDYCDLASIGLNEPCFGLYLGPHDGQWIVALAKLDEALPELPPLEAFEIVD